METQTSTSAHRPAQPRTQGPRPGASTHASAAAAQELRAWLQVMDAALRVIEQTAWEARALAAEWARAAREDVLLMQQRRDELGQLHARLARATQCGWVLTKIASGYRFHLTRSAFTTRASAARALGSPLFFSRIFFAAALAFLKPTGVLMWIALRSSLHWPWMYLWRW